MGRARKEPEELPVETPAPEAVEEPVAADATPDEAAVEAEPEAATEPEAAEPPAAPEPPEPVAEKAKPRRSPAKPKAEKKPAAKKPRATRKPAERKAIVRLPKPERERKAQKERRGVVVSDAMDKTIVVRVDMSRPHPVYKKVVRRSKKFHAHDATNQAKVGDVVRIVETRPLSKTKTWRLAEVLEAAR